MCEVECNNINLEGHKDSGYARWDFMIIFMSSSHFFMDVLSVIRLFSQKVVRFSPELAYSYGALDDGLWPVMWKGLMQRGVKKYIGERKIWWGLRQGLIMGEKGYDKREILCKINRLHVCTVVENDYVYGKKRAQRYLVKIEHSWGRVNKQMKHEVLSYHEIYLNIGMNKKYTEKAFSA